jgi:hypothetical protein
MFHRTTTVCIGLGATLMLAQVVFATGSPQTAVEFAPSVTARLQHDFGVSETGVLRTAIVSALDKAEHHAALPEGLTLTVTVRELQPTHPTMKQQLDNPSLSPARTRYLGGADLVGELRDSKQQVVLTLDYRNFADVLTAGSPSLDPWADARQSIDAFAAKFAASWDRLPRS